MSALPKEPRQKMINMMYLVLTAMLALNVSAEILNAFKTVNESLLTANVTIDSKNADIFRSFQEKLNDPKTAERAKIWEPKAQQVKKYSDDIVRYIDGLKMDIMKAAGYTAENPEKMKDDDLEATTRIMSDPGTKGKELLQKLTDYKKNVLGVDSSVNKEFGKDLPINLNIPKSNNQSSKKDWGSAYFNMTPAIAAITILSKFQNDVKNSEAMVVDFLHRKVGEVQLVYDEFQAFAGTNSLYLMPGQELQITAGVGAFSKAAQPSVTIDGSPVTLNADGVAEYKSNVGGPGTYTKKVVINFIKPDGTPSQVTKDVQFTVGNPTGISVSADDVKVLYIGLDNHISIGGGTAGDEKISVSMDNGTLTKTGAGKYVTRPGKPGTATINVTVDGKTTPFTFRVKTVPDPVAKVGNNKGGRMRVNEFKAQFGVRADLENFVFEGVRFSVQSFTITFNGAGFSQFTFQDVNGDSFDSIRNLIEKCKIGTSVIIDNIEANGPGGTRLLPPIAFNLY